MEEFDFDKRIFGVAVCPDCGFTWTTTVPLDQFFCLTCPCCGGLVGELQGAQVCY